MEGGRRVVVIESADLCGVPVLPTWDEKLAAKQGSPKVQVDRDTRHLQETVDIVCT